MAYKKSSRPSGPHRRPRVELPSFALPFVTRSLRGGRLRRFALLSLALAALSLLSGIWLALGEGTFEREFRTIIGLEQPLWEREQTDHSIVIHDVREYKRLAEFERSLRTNNLSDDERTQIRRMATDDYKWGREDNYRLVNTVLQNSLLLATVGRTTPRKFREQNLRERALTVLNSLPPEAIVHRNSLHYEDDQIFNFQIETDVRQLASILEKQGIPTIELYRSPFGAFEALMLSGIISGVFFSLLLLVVSPLLVGVQQAQEVHENTLMPLIGTAMKPQHLLMGLASGPLSVVCIFAIPQALIFLVMSIFAGHPFMAIGMLATTTTAATAMIVASQILGHFAGKKRPPGIITLVLFASCGMAWSLGASLGLSLDEIGDMPSMLSLLPQAASIHFLRETFLPSRLSAIDFGNALVAAWVGAAGALLLAAIASRALVVKMSEEYRPLLRRNDAMIAAGVCTLLVLVALPSPGGADLSTMREESARFFFGSLALLALPLAVLLMARVPQGDIPARLRRVPVIKLLGELCIAVIFAAIASVPFLSSAEFLDPVSLAYLVWSIVVLGLLAMRIASVPSSIPSTVWTLFSCFALCVGFVHAIAWASDADLNIHDVFALSYLSPVLGVLQAALTVWIPVSLMVAMRKNLAGLSSARVHPLEHSNHTR